MLYAFAFLFLFTVGGLKILLVLLLKVLLNKSSEFILIKINIIFNKKLYWSAICWKLLIIKLLNRIKYYLVKIFYLEQSAGNRKGTSETTRCRITHMRNVRYSPLNNIFIYSQNLNKRYYSTNNNSLSNKKLGNNINFKYIKNYNLYEDRLTIFKELNLKSGIYCLYNNINDNFYIGSSINLKGRMKNYLNKAYLKSKQNFNMPITKALLKYGYANFDLFILEYTQLNKISIRETYYITTLLPYYNVLKEGYSSIGYKHTEETKYLLKQLALNRIHSPETKDLIRKALTGENNPFYNKNHSIETKVALMEANSKYPIYIYNSFKELLLIYPSTLTFAKSVNANFLTIEKVIKNNTLFRGEWYIREIPYNIHDKPLIKDIFSIKGKELIEDIKKYSFIKKAIFVYTNKYEFIKKFDGVTQVQKELNINHSIVREYAKIGKIYKNYIFSYERINK